METEEPGKDIIMTMRHEFTVIKKPEAYDKEVNLTEAGPIYLNAF